MQTSFFCKYPRTRIEKKKIVLGAKVVRLPRLDFELGLAQVKTWLGSPSQP